MLAVWFDSNAVKMMTAEHDKVLNAVINTVIRYLNSLTGIILSKNLFNFETDNLNVNDVIQ